MQLVVVNQRVIRFTQDKTSQRKFVRIFSAFPQKSVLVSGDVNRSARVDEFSPLVLGTDPLFHQHTANIHAAFAFNQFNILSKSYNSRSYYSNELCRPAPARCTGTPNMVFVAHFAEKRR